MDAKLQAAIDDLFTYETIAVSPFPKNFQTEAELDLFLKEQVEKIEPLIKFEYKNKFDTIISLLKPQLILSNK